MAKQERHAYVLWMDYAREWAHELDTFREQWHKKKMNPQEGFADVVLIDYTRPQSLQQAREWLSEAITFSNKTQEWLSQYKLDSKRRKTSERRDTERQEKLSELNFWTSVLRGLRQFIHMEMQKPENQVTYTEAENTAFNNRVALGKALKLLEKYQSQLDAADAQLYEVLLAFYVEAKASYIVKKDDLE
jgi:hypothetical protein